MKKIIGIGGEPATGKSTLVRSLLDTLGPASDWHWGALTGVLYPEAKLFVLGRYSEGETFGGTDRLSMAIQPQAQLFLQGLSAREEYQDHSVLFEGDRLFNRSFLTYCDVKIASTVPRSLVYVLEAREVTKAYRHRQRGDTQTRRWLRGQATKIKAILKDFPHAVRLRSESVEDLEKNVEVLREAIFK